NGNFDFKTSNVNAGISDYKVNAAKYTGGSLNVDVLVTGSAQQGGMFLSFGASTIDTNTNSQFTIEIGGSVGNRQFTFSSSTSLTNIAGAINTFTSVTGVQATVSGTGIKLASTKFGRSQYASIRVINDGGIASGGQQGLYTLQPTNANAANTLSKVQYSTLGNAKIAFGKDVQATVNGILTTSEGKTARINTTSSTLRSRWATAPHRRSARSARTPSPSPVAEQTSLWAARSTFRARSRSASKPSRPRCWATQQSGASTRSRLAR
ncbi:MAG: hypothetical protein ACK58T_18490, partial [Phycisphaerae bacterium]